MNAGLERTQREVQAAISDLARGPATAAALVNGSPRLSAERRLELYRRTYRRRLTGCLRASYPALRHALGDDLFDEFALDYLTAHPPKGPSLATLGLMFPDHLDATRPDRELSPERREHWADFLVDLARLERAFLDVYDGPGIEYFGARSEEVPAAPTDPGLELVAEPAPCLRLLRVRSAVDEFLLAARRGDSPAPPVPGERYLALSRRDWVVTLTAMPADEYTLLDGLAQRACLRAAAAAAGFDVSRARRLARDWAHRGLLVALHVRSIGGRER